MDYWKMSTFPLLFLTFLTENMPIMQETTNLVLTVRLDRYTLTFALAVNVMFSSRTWFLNQQLYLAVVLLSLLLMPSCLGKRDQYVCWRVKCSDRLQPEEGSRGLLSKSWCCHRSYPKETVFKVPLWSVKRISTLI